MHSRIIGLDLDENIREEEFVDNGFIDGNHDYVSSLSKKEVNMSYKWFLTFLNTEIEHKAFIKAGYIIFPKEFKKEYQKKMLNELRKLINDDDENIFNNFLMFSYNITSIVKDENGFYVSYLSKGDYEILSQFIVFDLDGNKENKFKLSGVLDYHA